MWSTLLSLLPFLSSYLGPLVTFLVPVNITSMWGEMTPGEKEAVFLVMDAVEVLWELGVWRFPVGMAVGLLFVSLFFLRGRRFIRGIPDDLVCAAMEYAGMLTGLLLGGSAFLVGALMMRTMHRQNYRVALVLLILLFFLETFPSIFLFLPKRPMADEPSLWSLMSKF